MTSAAAVLEQCTGRWPAAGFHLVNTSTLSWTDGPCIRAVRTRLSPGDTDPLWFTLPGGVQLSRACTPGPYLHALARLPVETFTRPGDQVVSHLKDRFDLDLTGADPVESALWQQAWDRAMRPAHPRVSGTPTRDVLAFLATHLTRVQALTAAV